MLHYRRLGLAGVGILLLASCQGTEWGSQVQQALRVPGAESWETDPALETVEVEEPEVEGPEIEVDPSDLEPDALDRPIPDQAPIPADPGSSAPAPSRFEDLADLDPLVQSAIRDLEQLRVLEDIEGSRFEPERSIRRGEFAQWLVLANNAIHREDPGRQIRLGRAQGRPIFLDVPEDHVQFRFLQALGAAGLIEGDAQQEFRPDSLLSRSDLIRLKLAVVLPPGPMTGSRQDVQRAWGFTDADRIPEVAVAAIVADRQAEHSTILHTFGVIRSFHPLDPVSRAEAALALSVMGDRSAAEALAEDPVLDPTPPQDPSPSQELSVPEVPDPNLDPLDSDLPTSPAASPDDSPEPEHGEDPLIEPTEEATIEIPEASPEEDDSAEDSGQFITPRQ